MILDFFSPFMSRTNSTLHTTEKEWENETTKKPRQNDYVIHVQRSVYQEEALTKYCSFDDAKKDTWKDDNWWRQSSSIFFPLKIANQSLSQQVFGVKETSKLQRIRFRSALGLLNERFPTIIQPNRNWLIHICNAFHFNRNGI